MSRRAGRHFLQLPGPSNVPDRVLRAMHRNTIDHRGPDFQDLTHDVLAGLGEVFETTSSVFVYPSSATGAWEAAMSNTLSRGDRVLVFDRGFFARKWAEVARDLGLDAILSPGDGRRPLSSEDVHDALAADGDRRVRAVMVVHNETSTGVTSPVQVVREALDALGHPALLMVDTVSSLAASPYRHDAWGIDVAVSGSQKALMLPPGLAFVAASPRALEAARTSDLPCAYWDWARMTTFNRDGFFPYTPATGLLFGLREALAMIREEGLEHILARHARHAAATRAAIAAWGLENHCLDPTASSNAATTVRVPDGHSSNALRDTLRDAYDVSVGGGLGDLADRVFRIGHLGDLNDPMLLGTLGSVELGLRAVGIPVRGDGLTAAIEVLSRRA